jgi:hypothetical protein
MMVFTAVTVVFMADFTVDFTVDFTAVTVVFTIH